MKKQRKTPTVLVIGIDGMVGSFLFLYFLSLFPKTVYGTSRKKTKKKNVFYLSVETAKKDLKEIQKKIHIDFLINCVVEKSQNDQAQAWRATMFYGSLALLGLGLVGAGISAALQKPLLIALLFGFAFLIGLVLFIYWRHLPTPPTLETD